MVFFDKLQFVYKDIDVRPIVTCKTYLRCSFILAIIAFQLTVLTPVSADSLSRLKTTEWKLTNFDIFDVDPSEILSGGPPKDGIPAIDNPKFVSYEEAMPWLADNEPVVAFEHGGQARAYPLQILIYHEIVNDKVGGKAVSVTFCPLCNASIVFDGEIEGTTLDFGTTGRLRNSDLIMYDRQTESWWQQFTGKGIIGDYTGTRLQQLPSQIISFATFRDVFADGEVLSQETGFRRRYGNNPYSGYDDIDNNPFLYRGDLDPRLPPMERVLSIPVASGYQLVPLSKLEQEPLITIQSDKTPVVVFALSTAASALDDESIANSRDVPAAAAFHAEHNNQKLTFSIDDGQITDSETGSTWNVLGHAINGKLKGERLQQIDSGVHFAFAWLAFDPDAVVYDQ